MNANYLAVAALGGHVTLYKYVSKTSNDEELADIPLLEVPVCYETTGEVANNSNSRELKSYLRPKIGFRRQLGFQPELVCLLLCPPHQKPPVVNNILVHPKHKMLLFGTEESIVCVEFTNRTIMLNISLVDFYGSQDPFHRSAGQKSSPKKANKGTADFDEANNVNEPVRSSAHLGNEKRKYQRIKFLN